MSKRTRIGKRYVTRRKNGQIKTNVDVGRSLSADRRSKSKNTVKAGRGHQGDIKRAEGGCGCGANSSMGGKTFAACGCGSKKKAETFGSESGGAGHLVCTECRTSHDIRKTGGWLLYGMGQGRMKEILCPDCGEEAYPDYYGGRYGEGAGHLVCTYDGCRRSGDINTDGWYIGSLGQNPTVYCPQHGEEEYPSYYAESFGAESRFDKLANKVAKDYESKGYSDKEAMEIGKKVAYTQGVKKYGKAGMTRLAKEGRKKAMKKSADSYSLNAESGQVNTMQATQSWQNSEPYATLEGYNPVDSVIASPPLGRGATQDFGAEYEGHQGYDDKMDESMGMRHRGKHSQSMKDRRDEASAMDKRHSKMGRKYDDVMTMDAEYDSPYGPRQSTDFGMVGMGNDFAQNAAETFSAEGGSEFMTGARYGAGAVIGITGATLILGTVMNLFMRK